MGAKDPAIDAMIAELLRARDRANFVSAVRALDRVMMSGFYAIPVFNLGDQWIARWNRIERPKDTALVGYLPESWWQRPDGQGEVTRRGLRNGALGEPTQRIADARRAVPARSWPASRRCWRSSIPRTSARHRPAAETADLRAGRPRHLRARRAFHRRRPARPFRDRRAIAEHGRVRADRACRASRRPRGRAVPAVVAPGGTGRRSQPHQRTGDRDDGQDRRRRSCRSRHECRGRSVFDPPCLRLRLRPAGRHGLARRCAGAALAQPARR